MIIQNWGLRKKLVFILLGVGVIPLLIGSSLFYSKSAIESEALAKERAKLVAEGKADDVVAYLNAEADAMADLAANPYVSQALEDFSSQIKKFDASSSDYTRFRSDVLRFYSETFSKNYSDKTKTQLDVQSIVSKLDPVAILAQHDFIVANENPLGEKDKLVSPRRISAYGQSHISYHEFFRGYLLRHALYDLFLVDPDGRVVYTVFKETDFATSLKTGPWAETSLAKAYQSSKSLQAGNVHIEDFAAYLPSYDAPASFAATPIIKGGKYIGSLMIQLPLDKISAIAANRTGLGLKGETLLLGSDLKLRADTFRNKKTHNVTLAFAKGSKVTVESEAVLKAKSGQAGATSNVSYDGLKTVAYYLPIHIKNLTWYVITELSHEEVYASLNHILYSLIGIIIVGCVLIAFIARAFGSQIARSIRDVAENLKESSSRVSAGSVTSASTASRLSEAAAEQAASLQETMASIEEISAMVNQNAESTQVAQKAVESNQTLSDEGSHRVTEMVRVISEIKNSNDDLVSHVTESSKEFDNIIKIISEIGGKTKIINDIVFQTKLLSFNASVEAARAGENGKGFAVVAEEIGNLAKMSGTAAKEITEMLNQSVEKVNQIVQSTTTRVDRLVELGTDKITEGQQMAQACQEALAKISSNAKSITTIISDITHASKEQASGIQEINKAVGQLDQVTQQNSGIAQSSSTQADLLKEESVSLSGAVINLIQVVDGAMENDSESDYQSGLQAEDGLQSNTVRTLLSSKKQKKKVS